MSIPWLQEYSLWLSRNDNLKCFKTADEAIAYYAAWKINDHWSITKKLEYILSSTNRLDILNWLNNPVLSERIEQLEDGPQKILEEWCDGDFSFYVDSVPYSIHWITRNGNTINPDNYEVLTNRIVNRFLKLSMVERIAEIRNMVAYIKSAHYDRPVSFEKLLTAKLYIDILEASSVSTPNLSALDADLPLVLSVKTEITGRLDNLIDLWYTVSRSVSRPLNMSEIKTAVSVYNLYDILKRSETSNTRNLLSFLRCEE